jgi:hypothetical protein
MPLIAIKPERLLEPLVERPVAGRMSLTLLVVHTIVSFFAVFVELVRFTIDGLEDALSAEQLPRKLTPYVMFRASPVFSMPLHRIVPIFSITASR